MLAKLLSLKEKIKGRLSALWWYSLMMFGFSRAGDVINLYIGMFLVPGQVSRQQLGAILPVTQLAVVAALPLSIVLATALKYVSIFEVAGERGKVKALYRDLAILTAVLSIGVVTYLLLARDFIQERLKFDSTSVVWLVAGLGVLSCWTPVANMAAQGLQRFSRLIISRVLGPVTRLIVILLLLSRLQVAGYVAASLLSNLAIVVFLCFSLRTYLSQCPPAENYYAYLPEMFRYLVPVGIGAVVMIVQPAGELWIVRHRLSEVDSAGFYIAWQFGSIARYLASAVLPFLFILVSEKHERGESTYRMHVQTLAAVLGAGGAVTVLLYFASDRLLDLRADWRVYLAYAPHVWKVSLVTTLTALLNCHMMHENACKNFRYLVYFVLFLLLEVVALYGLMGWPFFKPWLPTGLWQWVDGLVARDLPFILYFMVWSRVLATLCVGLQIANTDRGAAPRHKPSTP